MRKTLIICLALVIAIPSFSQKSRKDKREARHQRINALIKQEEEGVIAYRKHTLVGAKLTSDGYGGFFEIGRARSVKKALLFQLEITERKHPKEDKQTNPYIPTSPFIFGKVNYMYPVKLGVQQQILLGNKSNKNGVSVTGSFGGGISLGLIRPYYLEINDLATGGRRSIKYESADSSIFVSGSQLASLQVSGPSFGKGFSDMSVAAGLYAKTSLRFDYGRYNEMINALEVGLTAEMYGKKILQVAYAAPRQFFVNAYVSLIFGRRK